MKRIVGGVTALVVVLAGVWWFALRKHGASPEAPAAGSAAPVAAQAPAQKPKGPERGAPSAPRWTVDLDPVGNLQLEGQVVDADGHGVGGARVFLSSAPPRDTKSEADGTFSFDKLVPRAYTVTATSGNMIGGPATVHLTAKSDPVVLHLAEGATLNVTVIDEAGKAIRDAEVKLAGMREVSARTDDAGKAKLEPAIPGWNAVTAKATGYAPNTQIATTGSAGATADVTVKLRKGFAISGRVVDEKGTGVARAHVAIQQSFDFGRDNEDTVTDGEGAFTLQGSPAGSHTLAAHDGEHAPAHSAPVTVVDRPVTGIEIRMPDGGILSGTVTEGNGAPSPNATVRVSGNARDPWASFRQVTADAKGAFEIRGLARTKLSARAESDTATSAVAAIDLTTKSEARGVKLVLDVAGTIGGTVVDDQGAPIAETQVSAIPDFLGGGNKSDAFAFAGTSTATTDGAGNFLIHGLADGSFRLSVAKRSAGNYDWGENATVAKVGDQHVKLVLATPGSIVGKLQLSGSGGAPSMASVSLGFQAPVPCSDGAFVIKDVAPGSYTMTARSPDFMAFTKSGITVTAGKVTDLGVLVMQRGRTLTGKVVDAGGKPAAGALVRVGTFLFALEDAGDNSDQIDSMAGIRSATADQSGGFTVIGLPPKETSVTANTKVGCTAPVVIPAGTDDPPPVTLQLGGFGTVTGKVTMGGEPVSGMVAAAPKGYGGAAAFNSVTEGNFTYSHLCEGPHVVTGMQMFMMFARAGSSTVNVTAGGTVSTAIDIPMGTVTLSVVVKPQDGAKVDAAMVHLFYGSQNPVDGKEATALWTQGQMYIRNLWSSPQPTLDLPAIKPGSYSLCSVPITGNVMDAQLMQKADQMKMYCQPVVVAASPATQTVTQVLPAMEPFGAD